MAGFHGRPLLRRPPARPATRRPLQHRCQRGQRPCHGPGQTRAHRSRSDQGRFHPRRRRPPPDHSLFLHADRPAVDPRPAGRCEREPASPAGDRAQRQLSLSRSGPARRPRLRLRHPLHQGGGIAPGSYGLTQALADRHRCHREPRAASAGPVWRRPRAAAGRQLPAWRRALSSGRGPRRGAAAPAAPLCTMPCCLPPTS